MVHTKKWKFIYSRSQNLSKFKYKRGGFATWRNSGGKDIGPGVSSPVFEPFLLLIFEYCPPRGKQRRPYHQLSETAGSLFPPDRKNARRKETGPCLI